MLYIPRFSDRMYPSKCVFSGAQKNFWPDAFSDVNDEYLIEGFQLQMYLVMFLYAIFYSCDLDLDDLDI